MMMMYAVILAAGYFGDTTPVSQVFAEREKAIASVKNNRMYQVIGGPGCEFSVGQQIHRIDIGQVYPHIDKFA